LWFILINTCFSYAGVSAGKNTWLGAGDRAQG
jgi:hypothetical protein